MPSLRADPMFKLALDRLPSMRIVLAIDDLAAGKLPDTAGLLRLGGPLIEQYCGLVRQMPKRIVPCRTTLRDRVARRPANYGLFNAFSYDYGFQPIAVF